MWKAARSDWLAYPGELPVLDGISMTNPGDSDIRLGKPIKMLGANWWIIDGFEVKRGPGGGVIISEASNNNIIRRLKVHHNGRLSSNNGSGILLHDRSSNNLIKNCDSHNNRDDKGSNPGGDADGSGFVLVGPGNVMQGNRAWQNSDDGYDSYNNPNGLTFEGNWAWQNGYNAALVNAGGNGDGFKLGGGSTSGSNLYTNNLSWANCQ